MTIGFVLMQYCYWYGQPSPDACFTTHTCVRSWRTKQHTISLLWWISFNIVFARFDFLTGKWTFAFIFKLTLIFYMSDFWTVPALYILVFKIVYQHLIKQNRFIFSWFLYCLYADWIKCNVPYYPNVMSDKSFINKVYNLVGQPLMSTKNKI